MNFANDIKNVKYLFQTIRPNQEGKGTNCQSHLIHLLAFISDLPDACVGYHQKLKIYTVIPSFLISSYITLAFK